MSTFSKTSSYGYGYLVYSNFQRNPSSSTTKNANSIPSRTKKELSKEIQKLSTPHVETFRQINFKFDTLQPIDEVAIHENRVEFGQFVAREAQLDEEYWTAAWLRAESHWEDKENDRYADNYKRKFTEQAFNEMKKRCISQLGEKSTCIVTVKKGEENFKQTVLKCVVGTLDLSIRYLSRGQTFPGEHVKAPFFCLIDRKGSSIYGYIANLCVAKSARGQGIASSMLQLAIMSAKQQGAEQVFVHVHGHNIPAQGLYQKMGFETLFRKDMEMNVYRCWFPVEMKTSWMNLNPRRRFISCPRHKDADGCNFFDWVDPLMCDTSNELILGFQWAKIEMEHEINTLHSRSRTTWKTWFIGFICGVFSEMGLYLDMG